MYFVAKFPSQRGYLVKISVSEFLIEHEQVAEKDYITIKVNFFSVYMSSKTHFTDGMEFSKRLLNAK